MRSCTMEKKIASSIFAIVILTHPVCAATVQFRTWTGAAGDFDIAKHKNFNSIDLSTRHCDKKRLILMT